MKPRKILVADPKYPDEIYECKFVDGLQQIFNSEGHQIEYDSWCQDLIPYYNFVYQDKFGLGGNCQSAVIASLLNLDLADVPYFAEGLVVDGKEIENSAQIFNDRIDEFLEGHNLLLQWYTESEEVQRFIKHEYYNLAYQVSGKSPRGFEHVVIYRNGEMIHDPHPEGGGVIPKYYGFIVKV